MPLADGPVAVAAAADDDDDGGVVVGLDVAAEVVDALSSSVSTEMSALSAAASSASVASVQATSTVYGSKIGGSKKAEV